MSEFVSVCPKCRQRIMCDTDYVGKRVACPVCLQEIIMPKPPAPSGNVANAAAPAAGQPQPGAAAPGAPRGGKAKLPVVPIAVGVAVLAIAAAGAFLLMNGTPKSATPPATPPAPAVATTDTAKPDTANNDTAPSKENNFGCRAIWTFDAGSGPVATDSSGNHNTLTLSDPDISWSSDACVGSHSLCLSKRNFAQLNWPVVNTSNSFTVCTWVKLNNVEKTSDGTHNLTFVSIDGKNVSSFFLQLNYHEGAHFVFNRIASDSPSASAIVAVGKERVKPGVWYHLAGVYNASDENISLYINGELQMSVPFTTPWQGTGCTAVGRGLYKSQNVDLVDGFIDETRFYASALDRAKIKVLANKHNENVAGQ